MTDPVVLVTGFLRAMEIRDLEAARAYLADDVSITFPGGRTFTNLVDQVASSASRFLRVSKAFDHFDVSHTREGSVVYVSGTLVGKALDGTDFEGVRFVDRFEVRDGRIVDQQVWNDLAESGILARR